jgi:hypothetical protein
MLDNPLFNPGGYFTNIKGYEAVQSNWIAMGEIVNLSQDGEYQSGLIQRYDVLIHNMNNFVAKGCIPITTSFSGNGVGEYATYKVGDAVVVSCLYNGFDNVIILGAISLPGNMEELMGKDTKRTALRKLQSDDSYAPQPIINPDRAQNPSAYKIAIGATQMDKDTYKNTDIINSSQDRTKLVQEQSLPNSIELDSGLGDKGTYFRGLEYKYINGSYYHVVVADKEDECAKASKIAKVALDAANKLKEIGDSPRNSNSLITAKYRAEQHQKIHELSLESAKKCNAKATSTKQAVTALTAANNIVSGVKVPTDYKPKETTLATNTSEARTTLSNEEVIKFINYSQWNNQLKDTQIPEAIQSMYLFYKLKEGLSGERTINQNLIDKILADPKYKVFKGQG